jgi:hypothetical protein
MVDNIRVGNGDLALGNGAVLIDFVCMAKHKADAVNADAYTIAPHRQLSAYCARGAEANHEWVRVPSTPIEEITTGLTEERPPQPRQLAFGSDRTR